MNQQVLIDESLTVVLVQEPDFARKAERELVQFLRNVRRSALLDKHVAQTGGHGYGRNAREFRGNRAVNVRLDRVMADDVRPRRPIFAIQRGERFEVIAW